jgi:hypothetical protein
MSGPIKSPISKDNGRNRTDVRDDFPAATTNRSTFDVISGSGYVARDRMESTASVAFGRAMTFAMGIDVSDDESWTNALMERYVEASKMGRDGDVPPPAGEWSTRCSTLTVSHHIN